MKIGLIARADHGGIAAQTYEFARHMHPEKTLVVDLEAKGRGPTDPEIYREHTEQGYVCAGIPDDDALAWITQGVDVVFAVETPYRPEIAGASVPVVVQANPELWRDGEYQGVYVVLPTEWESDRLPAAEVLRCPVATDCAEPRNVEKVETWVHFAAPAFHDRNGTKLVVDALQYVEHECRLVFRAPVGSEIPTGKIGNVTVEHDTTEWRLYHEAWSPEYDALVLPRRYGGLSLTMNEAAARGLPIVSLDLPPQKAWIYPTALAPVTDSYAVSMKGGVFEVARSSGRNIARRMDSVMFEKNAETCSMLNRRRAEDLSWEKRRPEYERYLEGVVG